MKPTVVLVGRPNVGKSTLFNRLTRSRDALVADLPGLTRDRHYGQGRLGEKPFIVVDTGGFEPVAKEGIMSEMARQAREAIAEADVIIVLVDGRAGLSPQDKRIAQDLREARAPVYLAVNKTEDDPPPKMPADPRHVYNQHGTEVFRNDKTALVRRRAK